MTRHFFRHITFVVAWSIRLGVCAWIPPPRRAECSGRDHTRNAVSTEGNAPTHWSIERREDGSVIDALSRHALVRAAWLANNIRLQWSRRLALDRYQQFHNSNGRYTSVLKCMRISDGKQIYEYASPQLEGRSTIPAGRGTGEFSLIEGDTPLDRDEPQRSRVPRHRTVVA